MAENMGASSSKASKENPNEIVVNPLTHQPTKCWQKMRPKQTCDRLDPLPLDTPVYKDKVRFVCVSDTHGKVKWDHEVPPGDVLLHAGDFTNVGEYKSICGLNDLLGELPHTHKIVIAGNHDMSMEPPPGGLLDGGLMRRFGLKIDAFLKFMEEKNIEHPRELLTNCTYLEDSETTVFGLRVYGSPWQPTFCDWGFNLSRGEEILEKWNLIPDGIDVLMTHGPPIGHGDECFPDGIRAGCVELLNTIQKRVKPKYHVFGHIHEGYGVTTDGVTTYVNASIMTQQYQPKNPPLIFDIPLPPGVEKPDVEPPRESVNGVL